MFKPCLLLLVVLLCMSGSFASAAEKEIRGVWVTRFEWTSEDPEVCKENIRETFKTLGENHFNLALFQVRGAAETLYPSELEPWSPLLGEKDPGFDPMQMAIEEARKNGISIHAYINPMPLRATRWSEPPKDPNHLYYKHGPDSPESWVCVDAEGKPNTSEYYYMSPGIPEVQSYLRRVVMDLVRRYDLDGVHLDRIRYPGAAYSHDPISKSRFRGRGNPNKLEWGDWQREQLDKFINDLAAEIRAEKPHVLLSCSAWGIYNRYHIEGYWNFSSGYHDYYQDTWNWCRLGAMDFLVPMIYWNIPDPKPNYDELAKDFIKGVGGEHFVGGQRVFSATENLEQIAVTQEAGGLGTVMFSYSSTKRRGVMQACREALYQEKAEQPEFQRLIEPESGIILGTVTAEDGKPLVDAWVSIRAAEGARSRRSSSSQTWTSGADGRFAFLNVPPGEVEIRVRYSASEVRQGSIEVKAGTTTRVEVAVPNVKTVREEPYVEVLTPSDGSETTDSSIHLLGRTSPDNRVSVADAAVDVYSTGAFAKDDIPLQMGMNEIQLTATDPKGKTATLLVKVNRTERKPPAEPAEEIVFVEPTSDQVLLPGSLLPVQITGPKGRDGYITCFGERAKHPLVETRDRSGEPTGTYTASVRAPEGGSEKATTIRAYLRGDDEGRSLRADSEATVELWDASEPRVVEVSAEWVEVAYGLHDVRLGGPYLTRVPTGTRFEVIGRSGSYLKVRLSASRSGWIRSRGDDGAQVQWLPEGTVPPRNYFTSCEITGDDEYDRIVFSLREPVAFAVTSQIDPNNRLIIDFFNTHFATTWMSHKAKAQFIGPVTGEQVEDDCFRVTVPIKSKQIWGYWTERSGNTLSVFVRRPPQIASAPDSPLKGLRFALEAGHGGSSSGAVGTMGTKEKTINLMAVTELERILKERGADVIQVRPGDSEPSFRDRLAWTNEFGAHMYVSVHANASGSSRGFLRVSGTSTYYRDIHCWLPAQLIYDRLLGLDWGEFGVVGNFSYYPLRDTRTPGILIEQAFMSNPYDEARMLEPEYQKAQAEVVVEALEDFFDRVRE